ncbi:MAG: heavy metal-associated domain-containing protein [Candidatus Pseudobacter hemicellulosilyticus]|uniref:Heavy metal-associated domain-containing protein n=1 Tax=Candidatus Pseudobacter hemicellulosilyticus TaxID=3121375 RepID=A0AAJ5WNA6_9BACT|nr:MAG: heavy metal-associated domain-containing protein [Pseudobacter sp.]
MTHQYLVKGISCAGCIDNVTKALLNVPGVLSATVQKEAPQATVTMEQPIDTSILQEAVKQYGKYELSEN